MIARRPDLDALRGLAVLLVVLDHLRVPHLSSPGTIGVTVFFVLSGWLITRLLLAEHAAGSIDLRAFWGRRARRLLPALVVLLVVMSCWAALTRDPLVARPATVIGALFFLNNWPAATGINLGGLHHTWSLAVEEQFYLVWPLIVVVGLAADRGRRRVVVVTGVLLALVMAQTVHLALVDAAPRRIYAGTDTRASALLAGCLLALVGVEQALARGSRWRMIGPLAAAACVPLAFVDRYSVCALVLTPWVAVVATLGVIATAPRRRSAVLEYVGRRSYALYLWHHPLLVLLLPRVHGWAHWPAGVALVAASFLLAEVSWRFVEHPFLRRGSMSPGKARTPDRAVGGPSGRRAMPADA